MPLKKDASACRIAANDAELAGTGPSVAPKVVGGVALSLALLLINGYARFLQGMTEVTAVDVPLDVPSTAFHRVL